MAGAPASHGSRGSNAGRTITCPTKYRRAVVDERVSGVLRDICLDRADRYEITFLEIGTDKDTDTDHVHFLIQSVPP